MYQLTVVREKLSQLYCVYLIVLLCSKYPFIDSSYLLLPNLKLNSVYFWRRRRFKMFLLQCRASIPKNKIFWLNSFLILVVKNSFPWNEIKANEQMNILGVLRWEMEIFIQRHIIKYCNCLYSYISYILAEKYRRLFKNRWWRYWM